MEEDRPAFEDWCEKNVSEFNQESISYRIRLDGNIFYVRIQTYLREELPDGSCNIEGYIQNITALQHRRNDINTLTHAINNAKESIFAAKPDGTVIFANRRFLHNHGLADNMDKMCIRDRTRGGKLRLRHRQHEYPKNGTRVCSSL